MWTKASLLRFVMFKFESRFCHITSKFSGYSYLTFSSVGRVQCVSFL